MAGRTGPHTDGTEEWRMEERNAGVGWVISGDGWLQASLHHPKLHYIIPGFIITFQASLCHPRLHHTILDLITPCQVSLRHSRLHYTITVSITLYHVLRAYSEDMKTIIPKRRPEVIVTLR